MSLTSPKNNERYDRAVLANEIIAAGGIEIRDQWRCPFHDDQNPSGSIYQGQDGVWRFKCHSTGCVFHTPGDIYDVRAKRTGQTTAQVLNMNDFRSSPSKEKPVPLDDLIKKIPNVEAVYRYTNPVTNKIEMVVVRHIPDGRKSFKQIRPEGLGFVFGAPPKPWPIYNRARVRQADTVIIVEGEKCCHALHDVGIVATTSPGGAGKAQYADWLPLAGKTAVLWPDNDPPDKDGHRTGIEHMQQVAEILKTIDPPVTVKWIDPDGLGLPQKGDAVEFIQAFPGNADDKRKVVIDLIADAESISVSGGLFDLINEIASGRHVNIPFPWRCLTSLSQALLPGNVTLICGSPGASKSFLLDAILIHLLENNTRFCAYKLEDDLQFHLSRIFAMKAGYSQYLSVDWIRENAEDMRIHAEKMRPFLDSIGRRITCIPPEGIELSELGKWIETKARDGNRVIAVDPVTAATIRGNQWDADKQFLVRAKGACRDYGASLILVTHPKQKKIIGRAGIEDMAGGAAYQRFAHTILWIENHGQIGKKVSIYDKNDGAYSYTINRTISILKARNGKDQGVDLGFTFDDDRLRFDEIGIIKKKNARSSKDDEEDSAVPF